jgi:hypothetical protein
VRQNKKPNQELIAFLEKLSREESENQKARERYLIRPDPLKNSSNFTNPYCYSNMVRELYDQEIVYRDLFNKVTLNKKFSFPVERKHIMEVYFRYPTRSYYRRYIHIDVLITVNRYALFYNPVLKYTFLYKFLGEFDWETFKMDGMERVRLKKGMILL